MPIIGTNVPKNQNQPTSRYGRRLRTDRTSPVTATSNSSDATACHICKELPGCGYSMVRSDGQNALPRYRTYATSAFSARIVRGSQCGPVIDPDSYCAIIVITALAADNSINGSFSSNCFSQEIFWYWEFSVPAASRCVRFSGQ